jgi:hypothetical protein
MDASPSSSGTWIPHRGPRYQNDWPKINLHNPVDLSPGQWSGAKGFYDKWVSKYEPELEKKDVIKYTAEDWQLWQVFEDE